MKLTGLAIAFLTTINPLAVRDLPEFTGTEVYFELFAGQRGAPVVALRSTHLEGPFPDEVICYAIGALAISILEEVRPEREYRGRCGADDPQTLRQMTDRAMSMLPQRKK